MSSRVQEQLRALAARRFRIAVWLTSLMMIAYFGFVLLIAFDKPLMGSLVGGGRVSLGVLLGALVIVLAPVLTGTYVRWANRHYDEELAALKKAGAR
jgi:uncharacterized membrane protein (DUF485 family)